MDLIVSVPEFIYLHCGKYLLQIRKMRHKSYKHILTLLSYYVIHRYSIFLFKTQRQQSVFCVLFATICVIIISLFGHMQTHHMGRDRTGKQY